VSRPDVLDVPRRDEYTICTAVTPDFVFTVLTCGTSPLYGPPLVRKSSSDEPQTSSSQPHAASAPESCPKSGIRTGPSRIL
jgi:hypothetical protein